MIDNFDYILPLLNFDSDDDFYYLQLLQRKKEVDTLSSNSNVVKNYYIGNMDYLNRKRKEIMRLCGVFNARAMIRLNRRSWRQCALRGLEKIAGQCASEDWMSVRKFYERVCGRYNNEETKRWILDVDGSGRDTNDMMLAAEACKPLGPKFITLIPSKNGSHLITTPFDIQEFKTKYPDVEIHKDNPTNLYIP